MPQVVLVPRKKGSFVRNVINQIWTKHFTNEARLDRFLEQHPCLLQKVRKALRRQSPLLPDGFNPFSDERGARSSILQRWPGTIEKAISILLEFEHAIDAAIARLKDHQ